MKELIQVIARAVVDAPEQVSVNEVNGGHTTVFELRVAKSDLGKVIGKKGRYAEAMRILLGAVSAKEKKPAIVDIIDSNDTATDFRRFRNPRPVVVERVHRAGCKPA
jgi:predicted RNA-binding protein YlqC (UPF0109 family)